ncbi:MAG: hypothetical protein K6G75_02250 [Lachnospiraceae bacterium]|nr:hypothetical protein [Lachnospiraceae bacterium]
MMEGKIPENILKRSVLGEIKNKRDDVITGASFGKDCAVLNYSDTISDGTEKNKEQCTVSVSVSQGEGSLGSKIALKKAFNNLYAGGYRPAFAALSVTISEDFEESSLKELMRELNRTASEEGVDIVSGQTSVSRLLKTGQESEVSDEENVSEPGNCIVGITALGKRSNPAFEAKNTSKASAKAGNGIVATKWIGIEGSLILLNEKKNEIENRFSDSFLDHFKVYDEYLSVGKEAEEALLSGTVLMKDVSEHGIFGALWELSKQTGFGLKADLKKIPVRQEVIELCNLFDINPYEMKSSGMLLIVCEDAEAVVNDLENIGINASVIGELTSDNDKIVINGEEKRYLDIIKQDSVYKINV